MKIICLALVLFMTGMWFSNGQAAETKVVTVEVLYMNHGPMRSTINRLKETFAKYEGKISEAWYDFDSKDSEGFKKAKGVTQHTPCIIWIDGSNTFTIDDKEVTFIGFPTGAGPAQFQGKWTFDDVVKVLDTKTAGSGK